MVPKTYDYEVFGYNDNHDHHYKADGKKSDGSPHTGLGTAQRYSATCLCQDVITLYIILSNCTIPSVQRGLHFKADRKYIDGSPHTGLVVILCNMFVSRCCYTV